MFDSPSPEKLAIRAYVALASIVDNEKMIGSCILEKRSNLNSELYARVRYRGNVPSLSSVFVVLLEHLLECSQVFIDRLVFFPP
jgi:hypothetical protein